MATKKVLIPLDGSEWSQQVLPRVRRLLNPAEYQLVLLRAAEEPTGVMGAPPRLEMVNGSFLPVFRSEYDAERASHPIYASQVWETTQAELMDELQADVHELQDAGYTVSTEVRFGDPAEEIISAVEKEAVDLVIMATHGRTRLKQLVIGSVAEKVLRSVQVPVMLVRPFPHPIPSESQEERFT